MITSATLAFLLLSHCVTTPGAPEKEFCAPLSPETLSSLEKKEQRPLRLVFFSSWCQSCQDKLALNYRENVALIGSFDEKADIERVYQFSKTRYPCYYDPGFVAARFGVKSLPNEVVLQ